MKVLRYTLVAALAVAMSGGNQMFAMTSGSSSTGASSSSAASDSKEAKSASSSASTSTVAAEIQVLDDVIADFENQIEALEQKQATGGRYAPDNNAMLTYLHKQLAAYVKKRFKGTAPSTAPVAREQKAEALGRIDAAMRPIDGVLDNVGDRFGTISGKIATGTLVYALLSLGTILSCAFTSDLKYYANCPNFASKQSFFAGVQLAVVCLLTYAFWRKAGREVAHAKAAEKKEARPAH